MPPHRRTSDAAGAADAHAAGGGRRRREANTVITEHPVEGGLLHDLDAIMAQREALERKLEGVDERLYDLESVYLKECVELGGSLFDGYGVERSYFLNSGTTFLSYGSPTYDGSGSPTTATATITSGGAAAGVSHNTTGTGPSSSSSPYTNFPGSPSSSGGVPPGVCFGSSGSHVTATETAAMALRARTQNFTPAERIFSSTSVGAIGRVERMKALAATTGGGGGSYAGSGSGGASTSRRRGRERADIEGGLGAPQRVSRRRLQTE